MYFAISFEKKYKANLVAIRIVDIVKDIIGFDFQTGMSTQFFYRYIQVSSVLLRNKRYLL